MDEYPAFQQSRLECLVRSRYVFWLCQGRFVHVPLGWTLLLGGCAMSPQDHVARLVAERATLRGERLACIERCELARFAAIERRLVTIFRALPRLRYLAAGGSAYRGELEGVW